MRKTIGLLSLSLLSSVAIAAPYTVIAPNCLLNNVTGQFETLAKNKSFTLLNVDQAGLEKLIAAKDVRTAKPCGGFMDVSADWAELKTQKAMTTNAQAFLTRHTTLPKTSLKAPASYKIQYKKQVNQALQTINSTDMWSDLTVLTNYRDRYADSDNGVAAANWIKNHVMEMADQVGRNDVTSYTVATGTKYKQPSVVVKVGDGTGPGIVIGGHMDTLSSTFSVKPGADDDGSGTATVLAVARTIISSGLHFKKPIYFIWYSAEEEGLVGSGYVVKDFTAKSIPVQAAMQMDMTGYAYKNDPTMWLMKDYVNPDLTAYLEKLVTTYVKQPVKYSACGYACSDHASWYYAGVASSFPFEASFSTDNPNIHSSNDTMDKLSINHMMDYAKLGTAYAIELAEPVA